MQLKINMKKKDKSIVKNICIKNYCNNNIIHPSVKISRKKSNKKNKFTLKKTYSPLNNIT